MNAIWNIVIRAVPVPMSHASTVSCTVNSCTVSSCTVSVVLSHSVPLAETIFDNLVDGA